MQEEISCNYGGNVFIAKHLLHVAIFDPIAKRIYIGKYYFILHDKYDMKAIIPIVVHEFIHLLLMDMKEDEACWKLNNIWEEISNTGIFEEYIGGMKIC